MIRGEVKIKAGEKEYTFRYPWNSLVKLYAVTGKTSAELIATLSNSDDVSPELIRTFVWAGLIHAHPEMTEEMAGDVIDEGGMSEVIGAAAKSFAGAFPQQKAGSSNPQRANRNRA